MLNEDRFGILEAFLCEGRTLGRTAQGIAGLRHRVPKFFRYLDERSLCLHEVGVREAQDYQGWLIEGGRRDGGKYSPRSVIAYMVAVNAFYDYLKREGLAGSNPFREIRKVKSGKKLPRRIIGETDMGSLLEAFGRFAEGPSLKGRVSRYKAHVAAELLYATAMRVSEAAALKVKDIDFTRSTVTVREGKGGTTRTAYLCDYAREVLRIYVERIRPLSFTWWNEQNGSLFGMSGGNFKKLVNRELKSVCRMIDLEPMTSHGFRHAVGYHLLKSGCSIRHIQQILGHKLLRNTEIYAKVDREDLKAVLDACHPRSARRNHAESLPENGVRNL
mgnify:CR=1 FL=1